MRCVRCARRHHPTLLGMGTRLMTGRRGHRAAVLVQGARCLLLLSDTTAGAVGTIPCKRNARLFRIVTPHLRPTMPRDITHRLSIWGTTSAICTVDVKALLLCTTSPLRPFNLSRKTHSLQAIAVGVEGRLVLKRWRRLAKVGRMERLRPRGAGERRRISQHRPQLPFNLHHLLRLVRPHLPRLAIAVPTRMMRAHENPNSTPANAMSKAIGVDLLSHRAPFAPHSHREGHLMTTMTNMEPSML